MKSATRILFIFLFTLTGCATTKEVMTSPHTFAACTAVDTATTYYAVSHGAKELNPLMAGLLEHGWLPFLAYQVAFAFLIYQISDEYGDRMDGTMVLANTVKCGVSANNLNHISNMP